ncbi:MAG: sigma-70 region 4 domain-containing protein [Solirubrobacteraceae bacterium]|nr:sigma-70 region 4 domain-containing protein [Solirubrobacteraceae bacterium]
MSRLQTLPPDQRAVLQLLLQKDRSYDEIAQLLRLDGQTIRARAHAAVATLGPDTTDLTDDQRGELADFLLGEQTASSRAATRAFLEGSPAARAWARDAAEALRPLGGDRLPEIPAEPAGAAPAPPAPEPEPEPEPEAAPVAPPAPVAPEPTPGPVDKAPALPPEAEAETPEPPRASDDQSGRITGPATDVSAPAEKRGRIGSLLLVGGLGLVIAVLVILALRGFGGDDDSDSPVAPATTPVVETTPPASTSTTGTTSTTPSVNAEVQMRPLPENGGEARATATLITQSGEEALAIAGQNLQPTTNRAFYGLWFANSRDDAVFLGYAPQVGENGRLRLFDSLPETADPSQYEQIWLTREVVTEETTTPTEPGRVALQGDLPD